MFLPMIIILLFVSAFLLQFIYGITTINQNIKPIDMFVVHHYAKKIQAEYDLFKKTNNNLYKQQILWELGELEKLMSVYDIKYIFSIDLVEIKRDLTQQKYYDILTIENRTIELPEYDTPAWYNNKA